MVTDTIDVVTASDAGYSRPLAVLLHSLFSAHPDGSVRCWVLTDSRLPAEVFPPIADGWISAITVPEKPFRDLEAPDYSSKAALWRLSATEFLPSEVKHFIYLDADMLVRRDLWELWASLRESATTVQAVVDAGIPWAAAPQGLPWRSLLIDPSTPYFNAGLLCVNRGRWDDLDIGRRAMEAMRSHTFNYADQCALNFVLRGEWNRLNPTWNVQSEHFLDDGAFWAVENTTSIEKARAQPSIVHFNHSEFGRPWTYASRHPFTEEWFSELDKTAFSGWRPSAHRASTSARARAALRRVRKRLSGLF